MGSNAAQRQSRNSQGTDGKQATMMRSLGVLIRTLLDVGILSLAYFGAFFLRFDGAPPLQMLKLLMFTWPYVVGFELVVLYIFSVPYFAWRYVSLREAQRVLWATCLFTAVLVVVRLVSARFIKEFYYADYALVPLGVIAANAVLAFLGVTGVRFARRLMVERSKSLGLRSRSVPRVPTLLLGAGQAGVMIAKEIGGRPDLGIQPVGFLDDDPAKLGAIVHGVRVLGKTTEIEEITRVTGARQAIITIANASGADVKNLARLCEAADIQVKIIPGIYEILDGKVNLTRIRDVSIEDLLGRAAVTLDLDLLSSFIKGKRVLITGAGGSIGSELCRQVSRFEPASLALVEQTEFNLFTIHQELLSSFPRLDLHPLICDVCDSARLEDIFEAEAPQLVFHAAAHKHVPMMEWNPGEALKNNVFGTKKVADAAHRHGAEAFVLISTDKAVNPTSIMGATKRAAEMYMQALSQTSSTKFVAVRFGNVLGSTGSVVPIFKAQIAAGGPVTITDPEMKRHFMTIPEASQLVIQAGAMGNNGEIMLLDMGEPVRIADLAEELIRLSGLQPGRDIEIVYTGVRPGEKLLEELSFDAERMTKTRHEKVFVGNLRPCDLTDVSSKLDVLSGFTNSSSRSEVRSALRGLVVEMREPVDERRAIGGAAKEAEPVSVRGEFTTAPAE
jgi:FlaA1/EpsC-like NDP-sugar epimerase